MAKKGFSRRTFIKGTSLAIAGAAVSGGKIAQQGIFAPRVVHAQDEVVLAIQEFAHDAIKAILPDFESATGLTVKLEGGPVSGNDMLTKYSTAFAAGNSPVDVISDADDSSPTFIRAGWIMPLDDIIPQETWDDFPESMQGQIDTFLSYEDQRYRVPHEFAIGYFFTRKDWLEEKGVSSPATWDEMVELGKEFTDSASGVWGTTDGLVKPGLLYVYCAYLASQSGGSVFDFDEGTAEAFQFLYDMIHTHKIFPETALNQDYTAQNELYMGDKVAFMRQWPFFQSVAEGNTDWFDASKMAIELPPAGAAGSKSWWGGWGFSLPASAPNPDGAKELIKFLTSPENAPKLAEGQSWFVMPRTSILEYFADKPNVIVEAMGRYSEANVMAARPFHPRVAEAQTAVEDMASLFLTDQASLADVMKQGKQLIADLDA
ncbi:MAG TPA: extracellular solute-binding protein [Aggregatilinea sp.]|jgi:ABC-type glycerol-3-phosphate transport system substrate-binding protein|uniref:ABC transporter substrate-binding protein n=1 Tax=Aggregatilinea sp. TaxID=2806333 RepID=UPI002BCF1691|nr:extracellular solute-binding protein [Aggregatilinea sp.]HML20631.1 extracellular solute-binding protein [Aggregatilinea sp.]